MNYSKFFTSELEKLSLNNYNLDESSKGNARNVDIMDKFCVYEINFFNKQVSFMCKCCCWNLVGSS